MGRWDHLYEARKVGVKEYVLGQVADQIAQELRAWPPPAAEWADAREEERFRAVLARPSPPGLDAFRAGLELARLDLQHEVELIERFWAGARSAELLPEALERDSAQFLWRWLVVSALEAQEWAGGRFRRADLVALVELVEERMVRGYRLRLGEQA